MIIAEVGNNHFGSLQSAKDHIRVAKDCGVDAVKFQAFKPGDFQGSMPKSFYELCSFTYAEYLQVIDFGKYINMPVFFSIFNTDFLGLENHTDYRKLAAWQTNEMSTELLEEIDDPFTIVSVNGQAKTLPNLSQAIILYATDYNCEDPILERLGIMQKFYKRPVGLSDHSVGIQTCKEAIDLYEVPVIEKHFTLRKNVEYQGQVFRDTVHGCNPTEMAELVEYFKSKKTTYKGGASALYSVQ